MKITTTLLISVLALSMFCAIHAQTTTSCADFISKSQGFTCDNCASIYTSASETYCSECNGVFSGPNKKNTQNNPDFSNNKNFGTFGCGFSFVKSWWVWTLLLLVIAGAAGAWWYMKNKKGSGGDTY